jgi:hypothetical protein
MLNVCGVTITGSHSQYRYIFNDTLLLKDGVRDSGLERTVASLWRVFGFQTRAWQLARPPGSACTLCGRSVRWFCHEASERMLLGLRLHNDGTHGFKHDGTFSVLSALSWWG